MTPVEKSFYLLVGSVRKTTVTCSGNVEPESPIQHGSKLSSVNISIVIYLVQCGMFRDCLWRCLCVSKFVIFLLTIMPDSSVPRSNRHLQGKPRSP
jgi:hypothetical protein